MYYSSTVLPIVTPLVEKLWTYTYSRKGVGNRRTFSYVVKFSAGVLSIQLQALIYCRPV